MTHERRIALTALAGGAPALAALAWLSHRAALGPLARALLLGGAALPMVAAVVALRAWVRRPLRALANALAAVREGDFAFHLSGAHPADALGLSLLEFNALATELREERLRTIESAALLRRVMAAIDAAVFAFDESGCLRLVNRQGELLLARPAERAIGETAERLGLAVLGVGDAQRAGTPRVVAASFPGRTGRWEVRRGVFRLGGRPHTLLLVTDLSETLRAEERQAWQRLIRVLSHEINNSLAPIKTIANSLGRRLRATPMPVPAPDADRTRAADGAVTPGHTGADDFAHNLGIIAERAESLSRFVGAYARLTRLPAPVLRPVAVAAWVRRVASFESRVPVVVHPGPDVVLRADPDQLDQLLINLLRNAADAASETAGGVVVRWDATPALARVVVEDEGPGLAEPASLFVPYYSTKPEGSGIGLALCRQIAEAHGGSVTLENRAGARGARATVQLPRAALECEQPPFD